MNVLSRAVPLTLVALALSACGSGAPGGGASDGRTHVVVSFYPLQYLAERIGGAHVAVTSLTAPGQEPHELELTPKQVASASEAALGIYEKGLQPAVDSAFASAAPKKVLDVSGPADLSLRFTRAIGANGAGGQETEEGAVDPHFWLDPVRMTKVADAVARSLAEVDPAHEADYAKNAKALDAELSGLDTDFRTHLASCTNKDVVTSHAAFGYLTKRYGLTQVPIAGISPEQEPEPQQLATIAEFAKKNKVTTIYTETLASPAMAKTVAAETGATTAVLDPIEGITEASAARDYPGLMRANLATLTKGQGCS